MQLGTIPEYSIKIMASKRNSRLAPKRKKTKTKTLIFKIIVTPKEIKILSCLLSFLRFLHTQIFKIDENFITEKLIMKNLTNCITESPANSSRKTYSCQSTYPCFFRNNCWLAILREIPLTVVHDGTVVIGCPKGVEVKIFSKISFGTCGIKTKCTFMLRSKARRDI